MKRIEMNQMEMIVGGSSNPFWSGVKCGLGIAGGAILGGFAAGPIGVVAGAMVGVSTC
jgi:hypothetical protein